jgi:hypothetical protein
VFGVSFRRSRVCSQVGRKGGRTLRLNDGNSSTSQQQANGREPRNRTTPPVNGSGLMAIDQKNAVVSFTDLW